VRRPLDVLVPAGGAWLRRRRAGGGVHIHAGVDLPAPAGTNVLAPEAGQVVVSEARNVPPWGGYAPLVVLHGESGLYHLLAHLRPAGLPAEGAQLAEGDPVGQVGALKHCHWEVRTRLGIRYSDGELPYMVSVDPLALVKGAVRPFDARGAAPSQVREVTHG